MEVKTKLSAKELFEIYPEESRVELIDGEVYEMPAPSLLHQEVLMRIAFALRNFVKEKGIGNVYLPLMWFFPKMLSYSQTLFGLEIFQSLSDT